MRIDKASKISCSVRIVHINVRYSIHIYELHLYFLNGLKSRGKKMVNYQHGYP